MSIEIKYRGKWYTIKELAREQKVPYDVFRKQLHKGANIDCAIEYARIHSGASAGNSIPARDHLENDYPSMTAMARAYNLVPVTLAARLNRGWSIKKALTTPTKQQVDKKVDKYHKIN